MRVSRANSITRVIAFISSGRFARILIEPRLVVMRGFSAKSQEKAARFENLSLLSPYCWNTDKVGLKEAMSFVEAIILGLVQGLTEFLPVSSSGHLVLSQEILGVEDQGVTFEILVHFGTLLSVLIYFWKPLWRMILSIIPPFKEEFAKERRMIGYLALASVPAGLVGFSPLKDVFEGTYEKPAVVGLLLIVTGVILFLPRLFAKRLAKRQEKNEVGVKSAIIMGVGQAFAILPGVSRSGATIVSGMMAGVKSSSAAEFSFLMAIPAIAAASFLEARKLSEIDAALLMPYLAGALVAFLSGLIAIYSVLAAIRRGKFEFFGVYCVVAGLAAFLFFRGQGI